MPEPYIDALRGDGERAHYMRHAFKHHLRAAGGSVADCSTHGKVIDPACAECVETLRNAVKPPGRTLEGLLLLTDIEEKKADG